MFSQQNILNSVVSFESNIKHEWFNYPYIAKNSFICDGAKEKPAASRRAKIKNFQQPAATDKRVYYHPEAFFDLP